MSTDTPSAIVVPPDELARQASVVMLAYTYQLYQTVLTWLSLRPSELLHIEFAEDLAVSGDGTLDMTQIKTTKAALTLRSSAVAALIRAVWTFQKANPNRSVSAALITTGRFGKEKGLVFPGSASGLSYWRLAAREEADVEPMRRVLRGLDLPTDLKAFLRDGTADDIRRRILRPIRWLGSGPSQDEIESDLHDQLVHFGSTLGVGARDSKNALSALIVELLARMRRPAELRYVTAADLRTVFENNTYRLVPPSVLQGVSPTAMGADDLGDMELATRDAASIPLPPRAAPRSDLIQDLHSTLVTNGALWLHGSSGLGKTTLALLLARRQNANWIFADLRDLGPRALRIVFARLGATFRASGARGLILDDLPAVTDNATILAIKRVARAVANEDGTFVITSMRPPQPTLAGGIGLAKNAVRAVPYLTEDEVDRIVTRAGGDRRTWGRAVYLSCGSGHPQLVDARVTGLHQRGWPPEEQLIDLMPVQAKSGDLEEERKAVRVRLLDELDHERRELLLRLSLLLNNFDRDIMFAVAGVTSAVPQAGILFESLVGPWIEQVGSERYRLSPLLRDSGSTGLAATLRSSIRSAVVEHLMGRRPFPADQLMQVFIFAFGLKHIPALAWFSGILAHTASRDRDLFKRLAEEVSVFVMVKRDERELLFPENAEVSARLRYAQFLVAIATEDGTGAARSLDRMLFEIDQLAGKSKSNLLALALGTALMERSVPLAPRRWLTMLKRLTALPEMRHVMGQRPSHADPYSGLIRSASQDEMIFISRATMLRGVDELCELITILGDEATAVRDRYLSAASNLLGSVGHIVSSAWLSDVRTKEFDGKAAAEKLARLRETASQWANTDVAIELACAEAVMLDEYADDKLGALSVLAVAQADYPKDYRINRRRQNVYYRNGDHALALAEFESFASFLPETAPVDRAFAMREAGRSAAEIGELDKTRIFFEQAWKSARTCGEHMRPMMAGLSADCAILDFQAGKIDSALALMLRALTEAEPIDPQAGLKEHYCVLILMAAILWMRGGAADWPVERQAMVIGMCSNPDPLRELKDRPLPQRLLPWYELAALEARVSDSQLVLTALRQRTAQGGLLTMEMMLAGGLLQASVRTLNVGRFVEALAIYPRAVVATTTMPKPRPEDILAMPIGLVKPVEVTEWNDGSIREATASAVVLFALTAACSGRRDVFEDLRGRLLQMEGLGASIAPLFDAVAEPSDKRDDLVMMVASVAGRILQADFMFDARDAFMAMVYITQLLSGHTLGETAAGPVVEYFSHVWRDLLANRTFLVRSPAANGPPIIAALSKDQNNLANLAKLANLVLASEAAVRPHLSDQLRATIRGITERKPTSLEQLRTTGP